MDTKFKRTITECLINGERKKYDACSSESLEFAKNWYGDKFTYIGSGYVSFIDGTKNEWDRELHFFIKSNF